MAPTVSPTERAAVELWVDGSWRSGGDGSRSAPLRAIPATLPERVHLHLVSGLYEGPFSLPGGATVEGHGAVVLHAAAPTPVVVEGLGLTLRDVSVQGGVAGLRLSGESMLERVRVSGYREVGIALEPGGNTTGRGLEVVGTITDSVGVRVRGARAALREVSFTGDLRQGVRVEGGALTLEDARSLGGGGVVNARDAIISIDGLRAEAGRGPAVFLARGEARVKRLHVEGHESALHANDVARLEVSDVESTRAAWAGLVLQACVAWVQRVTVTRAGPGGGLQVLGGEVRARDVTVREAGAMGVLVRKGSAYLDAITVEGVSAEVDSLGQRALGDALMLRDAQVTVGAVTVRDVEGSALYASAAARVTVERLEAERTGGGLLVVERSATVDAKQLICRGTLGPVVLASDGGRLEADLLRATGLGELPVAADCAHGASVHLRRLETTLPQPETPCVSIDAVGAPGD